MGEVKTYSAIGRHAQGRGLTIARVDYQDILFGSLLIEAKRPAIRYSLNDERG